ncbi:hypothetical protein KP509_17G079000 [Ceratopteris richardii]|nr:hypothetical protein KP509_17G079000 [Ceratopteris richardii]
MLGTNLAVGNALIDMYVKCGLISKAHEVFNRLPNQDVVSWTALIAGYAKHGDAMFALKCLDEMQLKGVAPNAVTYVCCLIACGRIGDVEKGKEIHEEIVSKGLLETLALGNALVDMYANCGFLKRALEVFDILPKRDVISWNALMSGYVKYEYGIKALNCLAQMQIEGVNPDFSTLVCGLKACSITGNVGKGREIHAEISRNGFLGRNMVIGSALVDMYGKCGFLEIAHEVFDGLSTPDVISWNSLIAGYAQQEYGEQVLECYKKMQANGVPADAVTYVCTLKACGSTQSIDMGEKVHDEVTKQGLLERDPVIGSVLVDMYAKCGLIEKAEAVFDKLVSRDIVSWTSLIAGYTSQERGREALECFSKMELEGFLPNVVTFVCSLKACCSVGAIDKGREVHAELARKGLMRSNIIVGCAVVDMYAKAGLLMRAQELFHDLPLKDVNAWNVLISGYGKYEHVQDAITCFEQMQFEGIHPDSSTFVHVLNACCHASLVSKGHSYFEAMSRDFGIFPGLEHHTIMAVLCGHSGHLDTVSTIIKRMPINSNFVVWDILLALCRGWGNTRLGKIAFEEVCKSGLVGDAWI